jgi:Tol biopolymer transport system component
MEAFGEGLITFGTHEHHLAFTPTGDEIFFVVADRRRTHHTIIQVRRRGERWLRPRVAPFSGTFNDFAPTPSPDGQTLLFCSDRPLPGEPGGAGDVNIWTVRRTGTGWSGPQPLPGRVNDGSNEYNPTLAADGTLFFQDHGEGGPDIYEARLVDGQYGTPGRVEAVSSPYAEIGPWVFPDGGTLLFSSDRPGGQGDLDFWVSFRDAEGRWGDPVNAGPDINTPSADAIVTLSPDGKYLFFTNFIGVDPTRLRDLSYDELVGRLRSAENHDGTIFWIASTILERLRPE